MNEMITKRADLIAGVLDAAKLSYYKRESDRSYSFLILMADIGNEVCEIKISVESNDMICMTASFTLDTMSASPADIVLLLNKINSSCYLIRFGYDEERRQIYSSYDYCVSGIEEEQEAYFSSIFGLFLSLTDHRIPQIKQQLSELDPDNRHGFRPMF